MKLSTNTQLLKTNARKFVSSMSKADALVPIILLEACVTGGRSYYAYKRGGFIEGRERITEESVAAVFWLGGVTAFNKMGDAIGKKLLGFKDINFDVGHDGIRKPLNNFLNATNTHGSNAWIKKLRVKNITPKTLAVFKFTKVISSILLANGVVGFVVPKINQKITEHYQKSIATVDSNKQKQQNNEKSLQAFFTGLNPKNKKDKNPSFNAMSGQALFTLAHCFENDAKYKLISTDVGIAGGRAVNARNKYERREILFRDIGSMYFYLFCRPHVNAFLNYLEDGKANRLDPVSAKFVHDRFSEKFAGKNAYSAEEFEKFVFGKKNAQIPEKIKFENGIIKLSELEKTNLPKEVMQRAREMANLQPKLTTEAILTERQVLNSIQGGVINDPTLLKNVYESFHKGSTSNPMKFIPAGEMEKLKTTMEDYAHDIIKKAKSSGENITLNSLKKFNRMNFAKNALNLGVGFAISGYFLSTAIPKIQYWMTRLQTGSDKFPGVEKYDK